MKIRKVADDVCISIGSSSHNLFFQCFGNAYETIGSKIKFKKNIHLTERAAEVAQELLNEVNADAELLKCSIV